MGSSLLFSSFIFSSVLFSSLLFSSLLFSSLLFFSLLFSSHSLSLSLSLSLSVSFPPTLSCCAYVAGLVWSPVSAHNVFARSSHASVRGFTYQRLACALSRAFLSVDQRGRLLWFG